MTPNHESRSMRIKAAEDKLRAAWSYFNCATEPTDIDQAIERIDEAECELNSARASGVWYVYRA